MNPFILPNPRTTSKNTDVYNAFRSTPKPKLRARLGGHKGAGVAPKVHHATHQFGLHRLEEQEVGGWVGPLLRWRKKGRNMEEQVWRWE